MVHLFNEQSDETINQNQEDIEWLHGTDGYGIASQFFADIAPVPQDWRDQFTSNSELKETFLKKVADSDLDDNKKEMLTKAVEEGFAFSATVVPDKTAVIASLNEAIAEEILVKQRKADDWNTMKGKMNFYKSEVTRRIDGMSTTDKITNTANSAALVSSAIKKVQSDDAATVASGALEIASAVAIFLPPPASIVTDTFSGILGMFLPGAGGPSNQEVIDEMHEGFEKQKSFIKAEFERQRAFIDEQFKQQLEDIEALLDGESVTEFQIRSRAILETVGNRQSFLYDFKENEVLSSERMNDLENQIMVMFDFSEEMETNFLKYFFSIKCRGKVIKENRIQNPSTTVQSCLAILYNYLTIEKHRDMMMVRYLALLRNMEEEPSIITERLWGSVKTKMDSVAEFIHDIQTDENVVDGDHTDYTGLKIRCYIGGDPEGAYGIGNSFPNQSYHNEMQEYIAKLIGETETDYSDACKVATEKCEYTLVLLGVRVFKPNVGR